MSDMDTPFCFGAKEKFSQPDGKVIHLPANITGRDQLFAAYVERLGLPDYFGNNWDAFSDCLRDFSWVEEHRVVIVHDELPSLEPAMLDTYIDVLSECVSDWQPDEEHELVVVFPAESRQAITNCLSRK